LVCFETAFFDTDERGSKVDLARIMAETGLVDMLIGLITKYDNEPKNELYNQYIRAIDVLAEVVARDPGTGVEKTIIDLLEKCLRSKSAGLRSRAFDAIRNIIKSNTEKFGYIMKRINDSKGHKELLPEKRQSAGVTLVVFDSFENTGDHGFQVLGVIMQELLGENINPKNLENTEVVLYNARILFCQKEYKP